MTESFFDFRKRIAKPAEIESPQDQAARAMSVAELNAKVDAALRAQLPASLLVRGEISNLNFHRASGHIYFTLKDAQSAIDCVMFRNDAARIKFAPTDGMEVLLSGSVKVYVQRGRYQFYASNMSPLGKGALELAFEQLKEKLQKAGLFEQHRKRPLPRYAQKIALVTSRQAAALQDILKVLKRFPFIKVDIHHVPVQGDGSAEKIAAALDALSASTHDNHVDVIILSRGGGSLEDLWEFNEEIVARAMARCVIPIVTGIGHEVDVSIADLVADYHAHTPTEAAQVITSPWKQASELLQSASQRLLLGLSTIIDISRQRLQSIERHEMFRRPVDRINRYRQLLDDRQRQLDLSLNRSTQRYDRKLTQLHDRLQKYHPRVRMAVANQQISALSKELQQTMKIITRQSIQRVEGLSRALEALNPTNVLQRGFSITTIKSTGKIVRSTKEIKQGDRLITRLTDGNIESTARDPNQAELF